MKLALAQHEIEGGDVEGNVDRAVAMIERAADDGADLVVLPEIFNVGFFAFEQYDRRSEPVGGETHRTVAAVADERDVAVLAGSIVEDLAATRATTDLPTPAESGLANTQVFFDRDGERRGVYRKHHLFGYESAEADLLVPGEDPTLGLVEFEGFTVASTTCYDLRFPELYRDLAAAGATLVVVPSAWPYPRVEHWRVLSRARAVENQLYVATANGSGTFDDAQLCGRSTVYDPWGNLLAGCGDEPALVTTTVDPARVAEVREEFPAWRDRRR